MLHVFKFGGAALKDPAGLARLPQLLSDYRNDQLVIVVSAMGKTTNQLERLARLATSGDTEAAKGQFEAIRKFHFELVAASFQADYEPVMAALTPYYTELWQVVEGLRLLGEYPARIHDRIMAFGELLSSRIVEQYLLRQGAPIVWVDARNLIATDATHKDAEVLWHTTAAQVAPTLRPLLQAGQWVLTQGYIARTPEGRTTTLGREGSDYTAAILAHLLGADQVTIWKDVPAVMSADPRQDPDTAHPLHELSYRQAVEMTYYGATVIHPKTLKPLENKGIPLAVRSFLEPQAPGTQIGPQVADGQLAVPGVLRKPDQCLLALQARDLAFMDAGHLRHLLAQADAVGLAIHLVQTSALTLELCCTYDPDAVAAFANALADGYTTQLTTHLQLVSLLGYTHATPPRWAEDALLYQRSGSVLRLVRPMR